MGMSCTMSCAFNTAFLYKLELIQQNASLSITGAIRDTSREKKQQELGSEPFQVRLSKCRKLCKDLKSFLQIDFHKAFIIYPKKCLLTLFLTESCSLSTNKRSTLFSTLRNLDSKIFDNTDFILTNILLTKGN